MRLKDILEMCLTGVRLPRVEALETPVDLPDVLVLVGKVDFAFLFSGFVEFCVFFP